MDVNELFDGLGSDREMIGKHISVGAFSERKDHRHSLIGDDGKPVALKININFVKSGEAEE